MEINDFHQLQDLCRLLQGIKRSNVKGRWAPHKPVLLLSIIDWVEWNQLDSPKIYIDENLSRFFKRNWQLLVRDENFKPDITQPLHYLKNDGLWQLFSKNDQLQESQIRSERKMQKEQMYGVIDGTLLYWISQPEGRELIRMILLDAFFPDTKNRFIADLGQDGFISEIEAEILMESTPVYGRKAPALKSWEGFIRHHKFRVAILNLYNHTCCISRLHILSPNVPIVEACHIKPHHLFGDNRVINGLALCLNLHRAFDFGLLGISDNYRVLVRRDIQETTGLYSLRHFHGQKLLLPTNARFYPSKPFLHWHRVHHRII